MENKLVSADFNIEIKAQQPAVTRNIRFSNGDSISFSVTLPRDDACTISEIHQKSTEHVIALLQGFLAP